MATKSYSRRELFRTFGASALLLYPILSSRTALADGGKKRFLMFLTSSGVPQSVFWPTGSASSYSLAGTSLEALTPYLSSLTIAKGVSNDWGNGDSHSAGMVSLTTGNGLDSSSSQNGHTDILPGKKFAYNASIDQLIAASMKGQTPISSLALAIQPTGDRPSKFASYNADGTYVQPSTNPYTVFTSVFQPLIAACSATGQMPMQAVNSLQLRRKSMFDAILADLADASRLTGLSPSEKAKLQAYMDSINQIEKTLATAPISSGSAACTTLSPFTSQSAVDVVDANYDKIARLMLDLVLAAFQLDVTRVASLVWDVGGNNGVPHRFLSYGGSPIGEGYHDLTHGSGQNAGEKVKVITAYRAGELAYFLGQLKASSEGGSTLLDNSLTWWSSELGDGGAHNGNSIPIVLAGSAGGSFKTGRYLETRGASHKGVLVSILNAMGVPANSVGNSNQISPLL